MKLTQQAALALTSLRGNEDFKKVLEWLQEIENHRTDAALALDDLGRIRFVQGQVDILRNFRKAVVQAPEALERFRKGENA